MASNRLAKVVITLDGSRVEVGLDKIRQKTQEVTAKMQRLANAGEQNTKAFKECVKALNTLHKAETDVASVQQRINTYMKELGNVATTDLRRAYREGIQLREGFKGTDKELQKLNADLAAMKAQIDKNTGSTTAMTKAQQGFAGALGTTLKNLVAYMGVFAAFNKLKSMFGEFVEKNREFSDQMANVRKVSNLAMKDIEGLANSLSKIDSRTSLKGLMDLAYTGSKLGFGNYGAEGLEAFAKSAVKVQNALSEDMGADAMTALSKMVEVMGLIPKMGVERAMDATGSAIFKLASTSTATGTNIVEFSKRLMGLANIAHITTPELLAIGSAADSMALMPEVAATAFNKLITAVQKQPNLIENALHIEKGTISDMYQAGKMTDALVLIFEKMREKGGMNALMQSGVFKDLGSDGARLVAVMATMANRVDMLNAHLAVSREAFEEGTAVAKEYAIQMDTAAAYSERAANILEKAFVNPEGVDVVKEFSKAWYDVSKSLTENEKFMLGVKLSLQGIILLLKGIMSILPELLAMLMSGGFAMLITNLRTSEGLLTSLVSWFGKLTAAQKAFFKTAGWVGLALLIFEAGKAVYDYANNVKRASEFMKGFSDSLADVRKEQYASVRELDRYVTAINSANKGTKERIAAINSFNKKYGQYISQLLTEKSTVLDVAKAYSEVVKQMKAKIAQQAKEKDIEKFVTPRTQWEADKLEAYDSSVSGTGRSQYNGTWLKGFVDDARAAGKSIGQVAKELNSKVFHLSDEKLMAVYNRRGYNNLQTENKRNQGMLESAKTQAAKLSPDPDRQAANSLLMALNYALQSYSTSNAIKRINKKYKPFDNDIAGLQSKEDEPTYDPLQDAPDKDALKAATKAAQERKQALRKEMEDAQKESTGIISKLEEWYRLQEAAINDARADGRLTEEQAKKLVDALAIAKNESLATARRAVTTGNTKEWDEMKKNFLPKMLSDTTDLSVNLLETIQKVPVDILHKNLAKFNGDQKKVLGLDSRAFFDQMNAKAAGSTREAARLRAKLFGEAEKMVKQHRFIELATDKLQKDLETMGFITETYEQFAQRMQQGITERPDIVLRLNSSQQQARSQMTSRFNATQGIGTEKPQDMGEWFTEFTDNGNAEWMKTLPELQKWVKDTDRYKEHINNLYDLLRQLQRGESVQMTAEQMSPVNAQINEAIGTRMSDKEAFAQMGTKFMGQGVIPYRIDIENGQEALTWLRDFATNGKGEIEAFAQAFPDTIGAWLQTLDEQGMLDPSKTIGQQQVKSLEEALPAIQSMYYELEGYSTQLGATIKNQVEAMTSRTPIGIDEIRAQGETRVSMTESLYDEQIGKANDMGDATAAAELERQKQQAIFDVREEYRQKEYQIREQMGVTWYDQYENEVAMYQNMLNKKLISEKQFQKKKKELDMNLGLKNAQFYNGQMSSMVDALQEYEISAVEAKYDVLIAEAKKNGQDTTELENKKEEEKLNVQKKYADVQFAVKASEIIANTAVAIMQAYAQLGPIGGSIAAALMSATGALQLMIANKEREKIKNMTAGTAASSSTSTSSTSSSSANSKLRLGKGMLTYDEGNVHKYLGEDGRVYTATEEPAPKDGLVTHPIATTVQGQAALVAEKGPEIVLGRKTTRAIMMNEPELIRYLAEYDKHHGRYQLPVFDAGNVAGTTEATPAPVNNDNNSVSQTLTALNQTLTMLQQQIAAGIRANINMYGTDGLYEQHKKAEAFMKRYGK